MAKWITVETRWLMDAVEFEMPPDGERLELLQSKVEGLIEPVYLRDGIVLICNEEARLYALPLNIVATMLASKSFGVAYPIYGPVVFCKDGEEW
jgi:hypothetical protein